MSHFLTDLARDEQYQAEPALLDFFFQMEPLFEGSRPDVFGCDIGGAEGMDRSELASLPKSHLYAIAASINASIRNCVTEFEFADRILARAAGKNEEEVVPIADRDEAGQGFKGLKAVEEDMFDTLASGRAASTGKTPSPTKPRGVHKPRAAGTTLAAATSATEMTGAAVNEKPGALPGVKTLRIPVTVAAFLGQLGLQDKVDVFLQGGYDDLRVVAAMKAHELEELGLDANDSDKILRGGLEWQLRANETGILDNWARSQYRAGDTGILEVCSGQRRGLGQGNVFCVGPAGRGGWKTKNVHFPRSIAIPHSLISNVLSPPSPSSD